MYKKFTVPEDKIPQVLAACKVALRQYEAAHRDWEITLEDSIKPRIEKLKEIIQDLENYKPQ